MSKPISLLPSELAYVFSYMKAGAVIGWPPEAFLPPKGAEDAFYAQGRDGLLKKKFIVKGKQKGRYRFEESIVSIAATLSNPQIVVLAQLREGDGARTLTCHTAGKGVIQMTHQADGCYHLLEYPSLATAVGAAAGFVGAAAKTPAKPVRLEANQKVFAKIKDLAKGGKPESVTPALTQLGASPAQAKSAVEAIAEPKSAGLASVFYCASNRVNDAEVYSVFTNRRDESWVVFPPANADGPVVMEQTSLAALSARILVAISTRLALPI